jgi:hypothetical protein
MICARPDSRTLIASSVRLEETLRTKLRVPAYGQAGPEGYPNPVVAEYFTARSIRTGSSRKMVLRV